MSLSCNNMKCFTQKKDLRFVGHKVRVTVFRERMFIGRVEFVWFACEMCEHFLRRQLLRDLLSPSVTRQTFTPRSLDFQTPARVQTSLLFLVSLRHAFFALTHFLLRLFLKAECILISKRKCAQIRSVVFPFFLSPLLTSSVWSTINALLCPVSVTLAPGCEQFSSRSHDKRGL